MHQIFEVKRILRIRNAGEPSELGVVYGIICGARSICSSFRGDLAKEELSGPWHFRDNEVPFDKKQYGYYERHPGAAITPSSSRISGPHPYPDHRF